MQAVALHNRKSEQCEITYRFFSIYGNLPEVNLQEAHTLMTIQVKSRLRRFQNHVTIAALSGYVHVDEHIEF